MSLQTIKITSNLSGSQTTCNSKQDDNQNSGRSIQSKNSTIDENLKSATAIRGSVLQNNFEQSSSSAQPNSITTLIQQQDANYIFDNFSKLFIIKMDKQAPRPKEAQAQKSLLFMFEAIALQDKQRMKQAQKEQQQNQKELQQNEIQQKQQLIEQKQLEIQATPIQQISKDSENQESFSIAQTSVGDKSTFNTKTQNYSFYAQQLNQNITKQQELPIVENQKEQKDNFSQSFNSQKCGKQNQIDQLKQQRHQSTAQSPLKMLNAQENICELPVESKIPKKRNLSLAIASPSTVCINFQNTNGGILVAEPGSIIQKHKRESSANLKCLETNQTITINHDKDSCYNTDIYGQLNAGISTTNNNNTNFANNNIMINHQRSKSNISQNNLQTNSSSLTNYLVSNNNLSTQISYFENSLNQQQGQVSTKISNQIKNCFQQSYTSCNNQSINMSKFINKGNSKRKIVQISNQSQQLQQGKQNAVQANITTGKQETQESTNNQNNTSNSILYQQQQVNNTLLNINSDASKSLQNTQIISKKSFNIINDDFFKLNTKSTNFNNKENLNINRKPSLKENTINSIQNVGNSVTNSLQSSKYIFNFANKANNSKRNSFISSIAQPAQNELNGVFEVMNQKFQNKKNITNDSSIAQNQLSLRQQFSNNTSIYNMIPTEQYSSQNNEIVSSGQFISKRYNSKVRNISCERSQNNLSLKNSVNLKAISKNSKFNIRTINSSIHNPSSSTQLNANNLYNSNPQTLNENTFKSYNNSIIQSYQNIPDTVFTNNE